MAESTMVDSATARILIELIAILFLLSLNGLFALSEIAVVSSNRARLQQLAEESSRAERVLALADEPTSFLSTVQIGITLIGILAGALSGATLSQELAGFLGRFTWIASYADVVSFTLVVVLVTFLSLLIGELVPKSVALSNPERFAMLVAPLMQGLARVTAPVVTVLSATTDWVLWLMRVPPNDQPPITEEEIKLLLAEGAQTGIFEPDEQQLVTQALELDDISLDSFVTHRTRVRYIDKSDSTDAMLEKITECNHDVMPVCDGSLDHTIGVIRVRNLLLAIEGIDQQPIDLEALADPPHFVPETASPASLLQQFQEQQAKMVFVVDEYGGINGIVTPMDILNRLAGSGDEPSSEDEVPRTDECPT